MSLKTSKPPSPIDRCRFDQRTLVAAVACAVGTGVSAQQAAGPNSGFEPVQPGTSDVSPLRVDDTFQPVDFRDPLNFDTLYRIHPSGTAPWGDTPMFARRQGAITALFPQSEYILTGSGVVARIPAATEFYIGDMPFMTVPVERPGSRPGSIGAISERAPTQQLVTRIDSRVTQQRAHMPRPGSHVDSGARLDTSAYTGLGTGPGTGPDAASGRTLRTRTTRDLNRPTNVRVNRTQTDAVLGYLDWLRSATVWEQASRGSL